MTAQARKPAGSARAGTKRADAGGSAPATKSYACGWEVLPPTHVAYSFMASPRLVPIPPTGLRQVVCHELPPAAAHGHRALEEARLQMHGVLPSAPAEITLPCTIPHVFPFPFPSSFVSFHSPSLPPSCLPIPRSFLLRMHTVGHGAARLKS